MCLFRDPLLSREGRLAGLCQLSINFKACPGGSRTHFTTSRNRTGSRGARRLPGTNPRNRLFWQAVWDSNPGPSDSESDHTAPYATGHLLIQRLSFNDATHLILNIALLLSFTLIVFSLTLRKPNLEFELTT